MMRPALWAPRSVFLFLVFFVSPGLECGGQKVRNSPGVQPIAIPVFLEYNPGDGGVERWALDVVFELVAAAFGGASKFAATNLGLGPPRSDPSVAPGAENTCGAGRGGGLSDGDGLFELVVEDGPSFASFGGIGEESVDPGADDDGDTFW